MYMKRWFLFFVVALSFLSEDAWGKDARVKLSETVLYVGEASKKVPLGKGTLYVMDRVSKDPVVFQDVIEGTFDGNVVSSAIVSFSSGWHFQGSLRYYVSQVSKKPLKTSFTYELTGTLSSPDSKMSIVVDKLRLVRETTGDTGSLFLSAVEPFSGRLMGEDGNLVAYEISLEEKNGQWDARAALKLAPAVFFKGKSVSERPLGKGTLMVLSSNNFNDSKVFDKIVGVFSDNKVDKAKVYFSSGWTYKGNLEYSIVETSSDPYEVEIRYILDGPMYDPSGKNAMSVNGTLKRRVKESSITLMDYSWEQFFPTDEGSRAWYTNYVDGDTSAQMRVKVVLSQNGDEWAINAYKVGEKDEFYYPSGQIITVHDYSHVSIQYPNADYLEINNNTVTGLIKSFPEAIMYFNENESKILYTNGDVYDGTFRINNLECSKYGISQEQIKLIMNPNLFIDEVALMYVNGTLTYANGKSEKWEDSKTDVQRNKINGNYDKTYAALLNLQKEQRAEEGAALEKKWQAALPELRRKYGSNNVDAIYEYRLNRKTPVELFKDLSSLGLIRLMGPIYSPKLKNTVHEYVIHVTNRETGEEQYSLVLKFVHPFWSSPDWILDSYSTNF